MITRRRLMQAGLAGLGSLLLPPATLTHVHPNGMGVYVIMDGSVDVARVNQTHTQWIQVHLDWAKIIEEGWGTYDAFVPLLSSFGHRFVFMVFNSPWQYPFPRSQHNLLDENGILDQSQLPRLEALVTEGMERYRGPHLWMWLEEADGWWDTHRFDGRLDGHWGDKTTEFREVALAMRRAQDHADSQGILCLPSVARENWSQPGQRPTYDMDWLSDLADLGGLDLVDWWGCNYYAPGFYPVYGNGPFSVIKKLKTVQGTLPSQYRNKPLFVNTAHQLAPQECVYMRQSSAHLWAAPYLHGLNVAAFTVFCWQHFRSGEHQTWGLLDQLHQPRPGYREFAALNNLVSRKVVSATGSLESGYALTLEDQTTRQIRWGCTGALDIQGAASSWPSRSTIIDIEDTARGFGCEPLG